MKHRDISKGFKAGELEVVTVDVKAKSLYDEIMILELSLKVLTERLDMLVGACLDADGKVKKPDTRDVMQARGYLPSHCKNAFKVK